MATIKSTVTGCCPKCGKGKIFQTKGSILKFEAPVMNSECSNCAYRFDKEPGYFLGAMYISYALTIGELVPVFMLLVWFLPVGWIFVAMLIVLLCTMFFNFRMSRILWIHIFNQ